jgi:hypothetical protein
MTDWRSPKLVRSGKKVKQVVIILFCADQLLGFYLGIDLASLVLASKSVVYTN